ncbi:MAG: hypothetical protein SYNGOMJ08_00196 [Candidatus Syntrophoarchaeum sp. GoM_oil]|nr:MAG: hypothetical protein SYNGOMJ08_00196 [Candidatus Syntrophoarchaeum sp. GoM_oil]
MYYNGKVYIKLSRGYVTMSERRLNEREIAEIVKMRGLGYNQLEIAQRLGVSQSAIQYQLSRINERARNEGDDDTFLALLIGAGLGVGAGLLLAKLLEKK